MKKLTLFLFFLMLTASLWAEEDVKETAAEKPSESGGFGGPVLKGDTDQRCIRFDRWWSRGLDL